MIIGNPQAPVRILMAASLSCGPCRDGFNQTSDLVSIYPEKVSLLLRFGESGEEKDDTNILSNSNYMIAYWQKHIQGLPDESDQTEQLLFNWYNKSDMDLELFKQQYPMAQVQKKFGLTSKHSQWMNKAGIKATPTFYINGYKLPREYQIEDLMGMIPSLAEEFVQEKMLNKK
nr:thioredoxin domain-containing protein [Fodinibius salsisoli]